MTYAWRITRDHLNERDPGYGTPSRDPRGDMPWRDDRPSYRFRLIDDDGILYYTGRVQWDDDDNEGDEDDLYEIWQWGASFAGTVLVDFPDHPMWTIG